MTPQEAYLGYVQFMESNGFPPRPFEQWLETYNASPARQAARPAAPMPPGRPQGGSELAGRPRGTLGGWISQPMPAAPSIQQSPLSPEAAEMLRQMLGQSSSQARLQAVDAANIRGVSGPVPYGPDPASLKHGGEKAFGFAQPMAPEDQRMVPEILRPQHSGRQRAIERQVARRRYPSAPEQAITPTLIPGTQEYAAQRFFEIGVDPEAELSGDWRTGGISPGRAPAPVKLSEVKAVANRVAKIREFVTEAAEVPFESLPKDLHRVLIKHYKDLGMWTRWLGEVGIKEVSPVAHPETVQELGRVSEMIGEADEAFKRALPEELYTRIADDPAAKRRMPRLTNMEIEEFGLPQGYNKVLRKDLKPKKVAATLGEEELYGMRGQGGPVGGLIPQLDQIDSRVNQITESIRKRALAGGVPIEQVITGDERAQLAAIRGELHGFTQTAELEAPRFKKTVAVDQRKKRAGEAAKTKTQKLTPGQVLRDKAWTMMQSLDDFVRPEDIEAAAKEEQALIAARGRPAAAKQPGMRVVNEYAPLTTEQVLKGMDRVQKVPTKPAATRGGFARPGMAGALGLAMTAGIPLLAWLYDRYRPDQQEVNRQPQGMPTRPRGQAA